MNSQGRPTRPEDVAANGARDLHRQPRARHRGGADLRDRALRRDRRRHRGAGAVSIAAGPACARRRARSAGPDRAGGGAPLRPPVAQQLFDRRRDLSARLVHDEAQSAPQREDGAPAGLRRRASASARFDRARRAGRHRGARQGADDDDRHERGRDVAESRGAWRIVRHDGDQGGDRGARRRRDAPRGAGPRFRPRHESGDRRADRLFRAPGSRRRGRERQRRGGEGARSRPTSRRSC